MLYMHLLRWYSLKFEFVNNVSNTDFWILNTSYILGINPTCLWWMISFIYCICFATILFRIFSLFMQYYIVLFSFNLFVGFWYYSKPGLRINREVSYFFCQFSTRVFWESVWFIHCIFCRIYQRNHWNMEFSLWNSLTTYSFF